MPNKPVDLDQIIEAIEWHSDFSEAYLELDSGTVVIVSEDDRFAARHNDEEEIPEWQRNSAALALARRLEADEDLDAEYVALPDQFEVNEYSLMERFANSHEDDKVAHTLNRAIRGSGAFRRFKDEIHRLGVEDEWYAEREAAYREFAAEWCQAQDIPFLQKRTK